VRACILLLLAASTAAAQNPAAVPCKKPSRSHKTEFPLAFRYRSSALHTYHVLHASGDKDFDLLAARALALAAVGHKLPPLPASYAGDSVEFIIMFGDLAS
jgi:hypothetical protein